MPEILDITGTVTENLRRALAYGRERLLLVISAHNCPGCEELDDQLRQDALRQALADGTYTCRIEVGDLYDNPPSALRLGDWTLRSPGFPTCWVWDLRPDGLSFLSLALGPWNRAEPTDDLERLVSGRSCWVPEAEGISIHAEGEDQSHLLDASNAFQADLVISLGATSPPEPGS